MTSNSFTEVKEGPKKYQLGKKTTNKYLMLKHGASKKLFPMDTISNSPVTESEFKRWEEEMKKCGEDIMTVGQATQKVKLLQQLERYIHTDVRPS